MFFLNTFRISIKRMEAAGYVSTRFIVFLKGTLGKMVATDTLDDDFINLQFWQSWPRKFYNIKSYDATKEEFEQEDEEEDGMGLDKEVPADDVLPPSHDTLPHDSPVHDQDHQDDQHHEIEEDSGSLSIQPVTSNIHNRLKIM